MNISFVHWCIYTNIMMRHKHRRFGVKLPTFLFLSSVKHTESPIQEKEYGKAIEEVFGFDITMRTLPVNYGHYIIVLHIN